MMTSWNGNVSRVNGPLCGEFTGHREFPTQRPVTRSFDVFFYLCLNKRLSKQSWGWWFETPSLSLWRHCNDRRTSAEVNNNKWFPSTRQANLIYYDQYSLGPGAAATGMSIYFDGHPRRNTAYWNDIANSYVMAHNCNKTAYKTLPIQVRYFHIVTITLWNLVNSNAYV